MRHGLRQDCGPDLSRVRSDAVLLRGMPGCTYAQNHKAFCVPLPPQPDEAAVKAAVWDRMTVKESGVGAVKDDLDRNYIAIEVLPGPANSPAEFATRLRGIEKLDEVCAVPSNDMLSSLESRQALQYLSAYPEADRKALMSRFGWQSTTGNQLCTGNIWSEDAVGLSYMCDDNFLNMPSLPINDTAKAVLGRTDNVRGTIVIYCRANPAHPVVAQAMRELPGSRANAAFPVLKLTRRNVLELALYRQAFGRSSTRLHRARIQRKEHVDVLRRRGVEVMSLDGDEPINLTDDDKTYLAAMEQLYQAMSSSRPK